jgi:hypothetical protein
MIDSERFAPVQIHGDLQSGKIPWAVHMMAYEVYSAVFGPQEALVDLEGRNCRGGFGIGELIAFLYARNFPRSEWRNRVDEALKGLETR